MAMVPIKLPPGVFRNGTRYQAKGRWFSANLVRWFNGAMRPIGGWSRRRATANLPNGDIPGDAIRISARRGEVFRDGHAWRSNSKTAYMIFGSNERVMWLKDDGEKIDITPDGLDSGSGGGDGSILGYGKWLYGKSEYGTPRPLLSDALGEADRWKFDNWGENLVGLADWDAEVGGGIGVLYEWVPESAKMTKVVASVGTVPSGIEDFVVTDERILMTIGSAGDLRRVSWSDQEDMTDWDYTNIANQAGFYTLPGKGRLISISNVRDGVLILTETDAYLGRYIGPPYIYSFSKVGDNCAPSHRKAVITANDAAFWLGEQSFWVFDGNVKQLPSELIDFLLTDAEFGYSSKIFTWVNPQYQEISWHYVSTRALEEGQVTQYEATRAPNDTDNATLVPPEWSIASTGVELWVRLGDTAANEDVAQARNLLFRQNDDPDKFIRLEVYEQGEVDNGVYFSDVVIVETGPGGEPDIGALTDIGVLSNNYAEPDSYVSWSWENNSWTQGVMTRTLCVQQGVYDRPVMLNAWGRVWDHELESVIPAGNGASTGPLEIGEGDKNMAVRYVFADTFDPNRPPQSENLTFLFESRQSANQVNPTITGPYTLQEVTPTRAMGREHMLTVVGIQRDWEWGDVRLEVAPVGTGFR